MRPQAGGGNKIYRVITDHLGSPVYVVNVADPADVLLDAEYDEWGRVASQKVNGVVGAPWPIPFGFAGGLYDEDTELVRFGVRDYDPEIGRWTAKDPILFDGGLSNLYVYVGNTPTVQVDPSGRVLPIILAGAAAALGVGAFVESATQSTPDLEAIAISGATAAPFGAIGGIFAGAGSLIGGSGLLLTEFVTQMALFSTGTATSVALSASLAQVQGKDPAIAAGFAAAGGLAAGFGQGPVSSAFWEVGLKAAEDRVQECCRKR